MPGWPTKGTFTSVVLRTMGLRVLAFAVAALAVVLGHAFAARTPQDATVAVEHSVDAAPTWSLADAAAYPDCVALAAWPSGKPAPALVVQDVRGEVHRKLAFGVAWRLNHNRTETDDVWVLGVCR